MKNLKQKWKSQSGETLTEALCALLIVVLSSAVMATMIATAVHLNAGADQRDQALYSELTAAEVQNSPTGTGSVTVTSPDHFFTNHYQVSYYGSDGQLTSYREVRGE